MVTLELLLVLLAIGLAVSVNVRGGHLRRLAPPLGPSPRGPSAEAPPEGTAAGPPAHPDGRWPSDHQTTTTQKEPVPC